MAGGRPRPGPAIATYYTLPEHLINTYPELNSVPQLRSELSYAYSATFLMKPHAIVQSYLDNADIDQYIDNEAVFSASILYDLPQTPASDLRRTRECIATNWRRFYEANSRARMSTTNAS